MDDPVGAAETVLARLTAMVNETSPPDRLRFTAALSNGRDLYAFRYAVNDRANTLYYRKSVAASSSSPSRSTATTRTGSWCRKNSVVVACAGERARVVPMFHHHQVAAE